MRLVVVALLLSLSLPAHAEPVTFFAAIGAALGTTAVTIAGFAISWGSILFTAASMLYGQATKRSSQKKAEAANRDARNLANASMQDRTISGVATEFPYRYIYGEARVGTNTVAILKSGARDEYKHIVAVVAQREITSIDEVYVNGVPIGPLDSNGFPTTGPYVRIDTRQVYDPFVGTVCVLSRVPNNPATIVVTGVNVDSDRPFAGAIPFTYDAGTNTVTALGDLSALTQLVTNYQYTSTSATIRIRKHLGGLSDPADAALIAECPGKWFSTSVLRGHAYIYVRLDLNQAEFQSGLPHIEIKAHGHRLYDPRSGLTVYSSNNALVIRDYITSELGGSINPAILPEAMYIAAANDCDDDVRTGSWRAVRYTFNGTVTSDQSREDVLENMAQSMAGGIVSSTWEIYAGKAVAPIMSLTQEDIVGELAVSPGYTMNEIYNTVRGQFIGPELNYVQNDYIPYVQEVYLDQDGEELDTNIDYPYTNDFQRCTNLARIAVEDNRNSFSINAKFSRKALKLRIGDRVLFTSKFLGQVDKLYRVLDKSYGPGTPVTLALKEDSPLIWDLADAVVVDQTPNTNLPNPFEVLPLVSLTCESGTEVLYVQKDGSIISRILVTWPMAPTLSIVQRGIIEIEYQESGAVDWLKVETGGDQTSTYLSPVNDGHFYSVRARCVNPYVNASSDYTYALLHLVIGKTAPPPNIDDLAINGSILSWTMPLKADVPDLAGARFRFHYDLTNFDWGTAAPLHDQETVVVTSPFDLIVRPSGPVVILGKLVDTSGNESARAGVILANLGDAEIANIVEVIDFELEGFPGTVEGGDIASDGLEADNTDSFYGTDLQSFYGPDFESFYADHTYAQLIYTTDERVVSSALAGSVMTLQLQTEGTDLTVEYRLAGPGSFYGVDGDPFYGPDAEPFYGPPSAWAPWPGQLLATNDVYQFRVTLGAGAVQAKITEFKIIIDAPDIVEYVEDMVISAAGSVVPYTANFTAIKTVSPTLQVNGSGAVRLVYDKSVNLAPVVWAYNASNVAVSGATADVILKGY